MKITDKWAEEQNDEFSWKMAQNHRFLGLLRCSCWFSLKRSKNGQNRIFQPPRGKFCKISLSEAEKCDFCRFSSVWAKISMNTLIAQKSVILGHFSWKIIVLPGRSGLKKAIFGPISENCKKSKNFRFQSTFENRGILAVFWAKFWSQNSKIWWFLERKKGPFLTRKTAIFISKNQWFFMFLCCFKHLSLNNDFTLFSVY